MAITTCMPSTAKEAFIRGLFLAAHTYKMGLFKASVGRTYNATTNTAKYGDITTATSDEVASGGGYTTGGATLGTYASGPTNASPPTSLTGNGAWLDWADPSWTTATFSADGCFLYDDTDTTGPDLIVAVWDFGGTKTVTSGTFTITLPAAAYNTAVIQIG